jgi:hypothetical protein
MVPPSYMTRSVHDVKRRLDEGEHHLDIAQDPECFNTVRQSSRFFSEYSQHVRHKRLCLDRTPPKVYIRYGTTGTGKTCWLDEQFGLTGWVFAPSNTGQWFDGCDSDVVLFDDIEASSFLSVSQFLKLTDKYPQRVPIKGGFITWKPKVIVFTSNLPWESFFIGVDPAHHAAVQRRVYQIARVYKNRTEIEYQKPDASFQPKEGTLQLPLLCEQTLQKDGLPDEAQELPQKDEERHWLQ